MRGFSIPARAASEDYKVYYSLDDEQGSRSILYTFQRPNAVLELRLGIDGPCILMAPGRMSTTISHTTMRCHRPPL